MDSHPQTWAPINTEPTECVHFRQLATPHAGVQWGKRDECDEPDVASSIRQLNEAIRERAKVRREEGAGRDQAGGRVRR